MAPYAIPCPKLVFNCLHRNVATHVVLLGLNAFCRLVVLFICELCPFHRYTEPADYTNHSCDPNAGFGGSPVTLVAMREIAVGEEITFDYAMCECIEHLTGNCDWECKCGTPHCRGMFTGSDWRRPELWERYGNYFSPYLLKKINYLKSVAGTPTPTSTQVSSVFPSIEKCLLEQAERDARLATASAAGN